MLALASLKSNGTLGGLQYVQRCFEVRYLKIRNDNAHGFLIFYERVRLIMQTF